MTAYCLDGKKIASDLNSDLHQEIVVFIASKGRAPTLAVIQVGHNPASDVYVSTKLKACTRVGIQAHHYHLSNPTQEEVINLIQQLNHDPKIDGLLLQLPLPGSLSETDLIQTIAPEKDVDGLHPLNQGYLFSGAPRFIPCTPLGCLHLIKTVQPDLTGKKAVVVGRSVLVGRPMASLLLAENATVTMAHSKTQRLEELTRTADILVVAMGRPEAIKGSMIKPGAIVIDVGINRQPFDRGASLVGDVEFKTAQKIASYLTPVPGGVGPMTVAFLLRNTLKAACQLAAKKFDV